jgi:hypothetical protein
VDHSADTASGTSSDVHQALLKNLHLRCSDVTHADVTRALLRKLEAVGRFSAALKQREQVKVDWFV